MRQRQATRYASDNGGGRTVTKRDFIQRAAAQLLPFTEFNIDKTVAYAERLWERLSERGYGAPSKESPRETKDWYAELVPEQRPRFDAFWSAFALKSGRNGAAMRWAQIDPSPELAETITKAAAKDAAHQRDPGEKRKWAQGWLAERRWEDTATDPTRAAVDTRAAEIRHMISDLAALKRMHAKAPSQTLQEQIARAESRIQSMRSEK